MSFVTITRDYIDFLNNLSDSFNGFIPISEFFKETSLYLIKTLQYIFIYIITFQWIRDFTLLPIVVPQLSSALIKEKFFLESSSTIFFNFLEIPSFQQNSFILGFLNSLSLTFPISIIHILTLRRLYIKGIPSAVFNFWLFSRATSFYYLCYFWVKKFNYPLVYTRTVKLHSWSYYYFPFNL